MDVTPIRANLQTVQGLCRAMALGLLGLIFLATAVAAQASFNFSRIDVEGNIRIDDSTVESFAGIAPGTPVSAGQLNAAYQRVIASGLFETVEILPAGRVLTIKVKEFPTINQVAIEGNQRLKDELLETLIQSQPRRVYSPTQAEADARAITEAYRQSGRLSATVTARIIPRSQNRVDVVYEVTEGRVVEVERIGFVGNRSYSERRLREVLGTKQAGFLRALINRDSFVEDRVAFDRQVLTDFYQSRGFIDFRVLSVGSEFSRERNAFFLVFNIQEGQRYRIGDISVRSDVPGLDAAPYFEILRKRSGQYYSPLRIEDGVSRIERQTLAEGRDFIRVTPELIRNERDQIVDVVYVMSRGPRIFVERIDIEGNEQTLDRVIRRQFDTVEGDPFNPREIRDAAERIRALGFFETAEVNASEGTSPDRVIIDVDVAEQPTGNIRLGLNYSVGDGASVAFGLSESNFLGRGQRLSFDINAGVDNASSRITLIDPALLGRDLTGGISLFYDRTENFNADYDTNSVGIQPTLSFPLTEYSRLQLRYRLAEDELTGVDTGDPDVEGDNGSSAIIQREAGKYMVSSVGYSYSYDTRDVGLDPNSGIRFVFGQDFAGLGGDRDYIRTTASVTGETKAYQEEIGLRARLEGGALAMLNGDSTVLDRFTAGRRVRGFVTNGIGPRDLTATNEDALGGHYYVALRMEANFPIGVPEEYGVSGGVFFDTGSIWGLDDTAGTSGEVDDDFHLRSVVGVSLFWDTPLGPLRFDFTEALQAESYDDEQSFDFSISASF